MFPNQFKMALKAAKKIYVFFAYKSRTTKSGNSLKVSKYMSIIKIDPLLLGLNYGSVGTF